MKPLCMPACDNSAPVPQQCHMVLPQLVTCSAGNLEHHILGKELNLSFSSTVFSSELKTAKVIPLSKSGNRSDFSNY